MENEMIEKAIEAYARWCKRNNYIFQQPSGSSQIKKKRGLVTVELHNHRGKLATVQVPANPRGRFKVIELAY
jgi:hypothetical protein